MRLNNLIDIQNLIIKTYLSDVKVAIDATLGNGKDTINMLEMFGSEVKIYAFDIQQQALDSAKSAIKPEYHKNVVFINDSHEYIDNYVTEKPELITFNLGYLPKSDHVIKTQSYTTLIALDKAVKMLKPGGLITIMFYVGHDNAREYNNLSEFVRILNPSTFKAIHINPVNQDQNAPKLVIIQKLEEKNETK